MNRTRWTYLAILTLILATTTVVAGNIKGPGQWTAVCGTADNGLACLPEAREGAAATCVGNQIFVTHGMAGSDTNDTRMYDISTDTWMDPLPAPPASAPCAELAGAAHDGLVYAVGGRGLCVPPDNAYGVCPQLEVYDPVFNSWSVLAPMPTPRAGLTAVFAGDLLFALGGRTGTSPGSGTALDCVEAYDPWTDTWTPPCGSPGALAPMPIAAMDLAAITHGGKIYVIGGSSGPDTPTPPLLDVVQIYDVASDTWTFGTPMPTARANLALGICGNTILALGGRIGPASSGPAVNTDLVEAYQIPKDDWVGGLAAMPTRKSEHGAVSHGGMVYVRLSGTDRVAS